MYTHIGNSFYSFILNKTYIIYTGITISKTQTQSMTGECGQMSHYIIALTSRVNLILLKYSLNWPDVVILVNSRSSVVPILYCVPYELAFTIIETIIQAICRYKVEMKVPLPTTYQYNAKHHNTILCDCISILYFIVGSLRRPCQ